MRLFVAVWPPESAIADLAQAVAALTVDAPAPRWLPVHRWHITLAFLGEVEESAVPDLTQRLARTVRGAESGELRLAGAGRFGRAVLWAGVSGEVDPLATLARRICAAARGAGIGLDDRPFHPHLTLARSGHGANLRPWCAALAKYIGPSWAADRVTLVRSTLGPHPVYERVAAWPVGRRSSGSMAP